MKINHVEFVISAVKPDQYPTGDLPEIALAGRSNVGKSSLINQMIERKHLARTSSTPGKTQTLNFYLINHDFFFVDLPGYGYAKVSKSKQKQWGSFIEQYILTRQQLRVMLLLIDFRHPPTVDDQLMYQWLSYHQIPIIVVATKVDKVPKSHRNKHENILKKHLGMRAEDPLCTFSTVDSQMKEVFRAQLWTCILEKVQTLMK